MTKRDGLFVKINFDNKGSKATKRGGDSIEKNNDMDLKKYMLCAGVLNKNGGTMIFQAKDIEEAERIVNNNPFRDNKFYSYEILNNNVIAL